jgi:hypothetical protein
MTVMMLHQKMQQNLGKKPQSGTAKLGLKNVKSAEIIGSILIMKMWQGS